MKKIIIMSWTDSNMAGDEWTWFITLTIRKNNTYSIGAMQKSINGSTFKLPSIYPLRKGSQVRLAIEEVFSNEPLTAEEINWKEIISALLMHAPELAKGIEQSFIEETLAEEISDRQFEEQEKHNSIIHDWVNKAKWPRSPLSHHIANQMDNGRRRRKVFEFVQNYRLKNSQYPTGEKVLDQDFIVIFPES